jgi:hypothetical protein
MCRSTPVPHGPREPLESEALVVSSALSGGGCLSSSPGLESYYERGQNTVS